MNYLKIEFCGPGGGGLANDVLFKAGMVLFNNMDFSCYHMCIVPMCRGRVFLFLGVFLLALPLFLLLSSWRGRRFLRGLRFPWRRKCIPDGYVLG